MCHATTPATLEQQLDNQLGFFNDPSSILVGGQFELAPSTPGPDVLFERDPSCINFSTTVDDDPGRGSENGELSHSPSGVVSPTFAVSPLAEWFDGGLAWPAITEMPSTSGTFNQLSSDQTSTHAEDSNISDLMWADMCVPLFPFEHPVLHRVAVLTLTGFAVVSSRVLILACWDLPATSCTSTGSMASYPSSRNGTASHGLARQNPRRHKLACAPPCGLWPRPFRLGSAISATICTLKPVACSKSWRRASTVVQACPG
jgi:hypothetical protein